MGAPLRRCAFKLHGAGAVRAGDDFLVEDCRSSENLGNGVQLFGAPDPSRRTRSARLR